MLLCRPIRLHLLPRVRIVFQRPPTPPTLFCFPASASSSVHRRRPPTPGLPTTPPPTRAVCRLPRHRLSAAAAPQAVRCCCSLGHPSAAPPGTGCCFLRHCLQTRARPPPFCICDFSEILAISYEQFDIYFSKICNLLSYPQIISLCSINYTKNILKAM